MTRSAGRKNTPTSRSRPCWPKTPPRRNASRPNANLERQREELERDDLWRTITIRDEADRARRDALIRMNEEVTAEARKKKQQMIDGFLGDLVKQLRATVYEATTDILATMSKNQGKLHPRSVVQLRNLIEQVGQMNFFGDTETDAMIRRVRSIFDQRPETRNAADLQITLRDVAIITRASLLDLGEQPRASRIIGDEDTTPAEIATARRRLDLDATPNAPILPIISRWNCRPAAAWRKSAYERRALPPTRQTRSLQAAGAGNRSSFPRR